MTCSETYYPMWSSRGVRGVKCWRPDKWHAIDWPLKGGTWALCGIHAGAFRRRHPQIVLVSA